MIFVFPEKLEIGKIYSYELLDRKGISMGVHPFMVMKEVTKDEYLAQDYVLDHFRTSSYTLSQFRIDEWYCYDISVD